MDDGKAIRYGITVGEEAMAWSGIAKIGSMTEWPPWHPTKSEISRLGVPTFVAPGPDNPMGSRALYLYSGGKDTLFRIHGTNQPEYIGASISSGCIRMTNEDVIDLYNRVKLGTIVVVLEPKHGDSPYNSKMALQGGGNGHDAVAADQRPIRQIQEAPVFRRFFVARLAGFCAALAWPRSGSAGIRSSLRPACRVRLARRIWRRPRAAAPPRAARPAAAARSAAADPRRSTGRSGSCCAAPSDRDGCGPRGTSPSPAPAPLKTARTPNAARSRAARATPCGRSATIDWPLASLKARTSSALARPCSDSLAPATRLRPRHSNELKLSRSLMALPRLAASGAMSVRIQSAIADAIVQRRIAAGFTATCRLSGSTTASSRTRSSPPQPPGPLMSGMLGAIAIASVSASRQAEGGGGGGSAGFCGLAVVGLPRLLAFQLGLVRIRRRALRPDAALATGPQSCERCPARLRPAPEQVAPGRRTSPGPSRRRGGLGCAPSISNTAATVTIAASAARTRHIAHLRLAFSALKFMTIP